MKKYMPIQKNRKISRKKYNQILGRKIVCKRNHKQKQFTSYCKLKSACENQKCLFAHNASQIRKPDYKYESDPNYKEQKCKDLNCTMKRCQNYHDIQEKRIHILKRNFNEFLIQISKLESQESQSLQENNLCQNQSQIFIDKKWNISPLIPSLTHFDQHDLNQLFNHVLKVIKQMNENQDKDLLQPESELSSLRQHQQNQIVALIQKESQLQNCINNVVINLCSRRSQISKEYDYALLNLLNKIPIINFKYKLFKYQRNGFKKQLSYFIKTDIVVPFVCNDIKNKKPYSLKLDIISLNKDWQSFVQLMETLQNTSQSIHKLDINLQEFIGPKDVDDIEKIFNNTLKCVPQLKVINLRFQFNYLENGSYERDIVDVFLELIEKLLAQNRSLKFQLNIFGIGIKYKKNHLDIFSDKMDRRKKFKRQIINKMFECSKIHEYFLYKFSQTFRNKEIKTLKIDFSNFIFTEKRNQKAVQNIYENEIECLLYGIQQIIERMVPNNFLEKFTMQFYDFFFHFQVQPKQKMMLFRFFMNQQFFSQNTPLVSIVSIRNFTEFSEVLKKKLILKKYKYSSFEGNLFTCSFFEGRNEQVRNQSSFLRKNIPKAGSFLSFITNRFQNVKKISYLYYDSYYLNEILLQQRQKITHTILLDSPSYHFEYDEIKILKRNQKFDFQRRQYLYFYAKLSRIIKKNKNFNLRKEIIENIFDLIKIKRNLNPFNYL
ncbi:hypothetical protein ABPG72_016972 [Tetrahymena utriculariae]